MSRRQTRPVHRLQSFEDCITHSKPWRHCSSCLRPRPSGVPLFLFFFLNDTAPPEFSPFPLPDALRISFYGMYTIRVDPAPCRPDSRSLLQALAACNIQPRPLWQPLHLSAAHRGSFARPCPTASRLNRLALSLPCSTGLTEQEQRRVIAAVRHEIIAHRQKSEPPRPAPITLTPSR